MLIEDMERNEVDEVTWSLVGMALPGLHGLTTADYFWARKWLSSAREAWGDGEPHAALYTLNQIERRVRNRHA